MSERPDKRPTGPSKGLRDRPPGGRPGREDQREPGQRRLPGMGPRFWWTWILMFLLLWLWQDIASGLGITTIPYSAFKDHLERGEVVACEVQQDEIVGRIDPTRGADITPAAEDDATAAADAPTEAGQTDALETEDTVATAETAETAGTADTAEAAEAAETATAVDAPPPPPAADTAETADGPTAQELRAKRLAANRETPYSAPYRAPEEPFLFRTVRVDDPDLVAQLDDQDVDYEGVRPGFLTEMLFSWILPIGILIAIWIFVIRRFGPGQGVMSFGRNKAKLIADRDTGVHFDDVAGVPEAKADLEEVVEFLKDHERFTRLGAAIPKGVLLVGPPGTGKTLLARAVAGEAGVPFFAMSGSDFVEMFVGVGASRVRDLFEQAKRNAPCIVFIDELDAIGRARAAGTQPGNDEREQTLNQLLVEMDGFEANTNVIILAATNRPENLDRALQRPGRFDRQVLVDLPDLDGRTAILQVHARGKPLADDTDLHRIAQATAGMAGADLANVINEGCLLAARRRADAVHHSDLMEAVEKVVAGPERRSRRLDATVRRRVAYHEVGHALVAAVGDGGEPVSKISIIPRGRAALGYTLQVPEEDRFLYTRGELEERLYTLLGGRAAEQLVFGDVSTGAENDLEKASSMARQMVSMFGMSERNGLLHCQRRSNDFLPGMMQRECAETTATMIDEESRAILATAFQTATERLQSHRPQLERIAARLLEQETIERTEFEALLEGTSESTD